MAASKELSVRKENCQYGGSLFFSAKLQKLPKRYIIKAVFTKRGTRI
ncbi:hypothetical protein HMPREF3033_01664 [Veillonellaceae bacterium DNF00751]|nr:hypothetical protein HMPREF3033_01664 [Veillonellaceae bacterium DNF00751]